MNWRSQKYLRLVAGMACANCGAIGSSQAAHSNSARFGHGRAIKARDYATFPLCHVGAGGCHIAHDQHLGGMSKVERIDYEAGLIVQTMRALYIQATGEDVGMDSSDAFDHGLCTTMAELIVSKYTLKQLRAA